MRKNQMTDLETTKLCAQAMKIPHKISLYRGEEFVEILNERLPGNGGEYNPLRDDEQCFALVRKFQLELVPPSFRMVKKWRAARIDDAADDSRWGESDNLNRCICECVAKTEKPWARPTTTKR